MPPSKKKATTKKAKAAEAPKFSNAIYGDEKQVKGYTPEMPVRKGAE
jgi:hypothetical protein